MTTGAYDGLLGAVSRLALSATRTDARLPGICRLACESGIADIAQFYVVEPDGLHLRAAATEAHAPVDEDEIRATIATLAVRIDSSVAGWAAMGDDPLVLNDLLDRADVDLPPGYRGFFRHHRLQHLVGIPIHSPEGRLGSFVLCRVEGSPGFSPAEVELIAQLAEVATLAVERTVLLARVARQADILDRVADAVVAVDENRAVTKWNHGAELLYGIDRADAMGRPLGDLFTTISHEAEQLDAMWGGLPQGVHWRDAVRQVTRDGRVVEVEASVTPLHDDETGFAGAVAVNRDVSAAMRAQRELTERQAFAEALLDALGGRTLVIDVDGRVRAVNARYEKEGPFGDGPGSGPDVGADALAFLDLLAHGTPGIGVVADAVRGTLAGQGVRRAVDVPGRDGTWTAAEVHPFVGPGGGALVSFVDVSERKAHELELAHRATHDSLTELPNRALMLDRLRESLGRAHRRGQPMAVLFVDLDGLKQVNDTEGHDAGDDMIRAAAERLARCCRVADTVARLGGDEFVVLLDEIADATEAEALALRMLTALRTPGTPSGGRYVGSLSASIGVALADGLPAPTEDDARDLVGHADAAMLVAKKSGKDQVVLIARPLPSGRPSAPQPTDG